MKNYYEILEVDIHASQEMIDRAYKLLAKRYHPDTKPEEEKQSAEEHFKEISEAYEILSDKEKRESYTEELEYAQEEKLTQLAIEKVRLEKQVEYLEQQIHLMEISSRNTSANSSYNNNTQENFTAGQTPHYHIPQTKTQFYYEEPVYQQYVPTKNRLKDLIAFVGTLACLVVIILILWKIPFTHDMMVNFYEKNSVVKSFVDAILSLFH